MPGKLMDISHGENLERQILKIQNSGGMIWRETDECSFVELRGK